MDPNDAVSRRERGRILLAKKDLDGALGDLDRATMVAPDDGEAWLLLGDLNSLKRDRQGAVATWKKARSLGRVDANTRLMQIEERAMSGDGEALEGIADEVVSIRWNDPTPAAFQKLAALTKLKNLSIRNWKRSASMARPSATKPCKPRPS